MLLREGLPFEDGWFDAVFCRFTTHHWTDAAAGGAGDGDPFPATGGAGGGRPAVRGRGRRQLHAGCRALSGGAGLNSPGFALARRH
ncbi:hypothetical protein [Gluconacetobacter dulcium]|uniref:hypothetical protein n=1 Tax=Gluconacetobacter dulcium TaxID=2729096 RepID=UPI0035C7B02D